MVIVLSFDYRVGITRELFLYQKRINWNRDNNMTSRIKKIASEGDDSCRTIAFGQHENCVGIHSLAVPQPPPC